MSSNYPKGSEWRKWDLHVHTPASLTGPYGGDTPAAWEAFITDLEGLPSEFSVIGVNDYLFLDGYKKLLKEKNENGRIPNIDLLLPVIEFRIAKFSGVEFSKTKRINLHIIFSEDLSPSHIEGQFLNGLSKGYKLSPGSGGVEWDGLVSKTSLSDLGAAIKSTVPPDKLPDYGSDLAEGFNSLNFSEEVIFGRLCDSTYFRGKYLVAIGNTEWNDLNWSDGSIAEKKDIINRADFVFVASESIEKYQSAKQKLRDQQVNDLLLDCSDAHEFSGEKETKDRIGNCNTWIKSDPTFHGLKQIINEPTQRLFVGLLPPLLERVNQKPTRFASLLRISKSPASSTTEKWFDQEVALNPGLIAVIGKKGSGKSAMADILALLGNTHRYKEFSFLTGKRFRDPKRGMASHFQGELEWVSGFQSGPILLDADPDVNEVEGVDYIPQSFLDKICNEIAEGKSDNFYRELQDVIFSHIPKSSRFGCDSLAELVEMITEEREQAIRLLVGDLAKVNNKIVEVEKRLKPEYRDRLVKKYVSLKDDIETLWKNTRPELVSKPAVDPGSLNEANEIANNVEKLKRQLRIKESFKRRVQAISDNHSLRLTNFRKLRGRIQNLIDQQESAMVDIEEICDKLGLNSGSLVKLTVNLKPIEVSEEISTGLFQRASSILEDNTDSSLEKNVSGMKKAIEVETAKLTEPQQKYEAYLEDRAQWRRNIRQLIGSDDDPETARGVKRALKDLEGQPTRHSQLNHQRLELVGKIFDEKIELKNEYQKLHGPIQDFIREHSGTDTENDLTFDVNIQELGFVDRLLGYIHQGRIGSFSGQKEGHVLAQSIVDKANLETLEGVKSFLAEIIEYLTHDKRLEEPQTVKLESQLTDGVTSEDIYDFLFGLGYLRPEFEIGWAGKNLNQLSPGEKGTLLLIFYLLVDRSDRPLIIDQPEENLDNETVFRTLVPCVKEARTRRQVLLVTHNPNLAVVCDADQIIHASIDKSDGNRIVYTAGSIENPNTNKLLVDVLEGTRPAFDSRGAKYEVSQIE